MDGISSKINMKIKLDLEKRIDKELVITKNRKLLTDIEGELVIYLNDRVFFQEKYILLLEFGVELSKWINDIDAGIFSDFIYETMDYSEGPILKFIKKEKNGWQIHSQWEQFYADEELSVQQLVDCSRQLLNELKKRLKESFDIDFNHYLNKRPT